ncbi:MAG: hypothetical protein PHC61_05380 [Chitinivibrionales bacterium]|nr:hypothetical protein [Chitinivibrionales bacterium]
MADLQEKIAAELENAEKIIVELQRAGELINFSPVELAGVGAFLHNFYNSIENIVKQVLLAEAIEIPSGSFWHRDLLEAACSAHVISSPLKNKLAPYLAFRHFFVHGYSLDLQVDRIVPLVQSLGMVYAEFKENLQHGKFIP